MYGVENDLLRRGEGPFNLLRNVQECPIFYAVKYLVTS